MKRSDYINWDEYFMGIALLTAMRSKDPNSQVGACIVSPENKILSATTGCPWAAATTRCPGSGRGTPAHQVYVRLPRGAQRHPQQRPQQPQGRAGVCDPLPLQRVHQGHHPVRHCRGGVLRRQVPRQRFQHRGTVHVPEGGRETDPYTPAAAKPSWNCNALSLLTLPGQRTIIGS